MRCFTNTFSTFHISCVCWKRNAVWQNGFWCWNRMQMKCWLPRGVWGCAAISPVGCFSITLTTLRSFSKIYINGYVAPLSSSVLCACVCVCWGVSLCVYVFGIFLEFHLKCDFMQIYILANVRKWGRRGQTFHIEHTDETHPFVHLMRWNHRYGNESSLVVSKQRGVDSFFVQFVLSFDVSNLFHLRANLGSII